MRVPHGDGPLDVCDVHLSRTFDGWMAGGPDVAWLQAAQQRAARELDDTALVRAVPAASWEAVEEDDVVGPWRVHFDDDLAKVRARLTPPWLVVLRGVLNAPTAPLHVVFCWHTDDPLGMTLEALANEVADVPLDDEPGPLQRRFRDDDGVGSDELVSDDGVSVKPRRLSLWLRGDDVPGVDAFVVVPSMLGDELPLWLSASLWGPLLAEHADVDDAVGSWLRRTVVVGQRGDSTLRALCAAALAGVPWRSRAMPERF